MAFDPEAVAASLQQAGYKLTQPRLAVLQVLAKSREHLNPAEVYERGRQIYPRLGLVTVYRTLDLLTGLGFIKRIHLEDGCHSYAMAREGHHHHLLCSQCGRVVDFEGHEDIDGLIAHVAQRTGFRIDDHWLELLGLCPQCQQVEAVEG